MPSLLDALVNQPERTPANTGFLAGLLAKPQGEMRSYTPPVRQRIIDYLMGDSRPSPEKKSFLEGIVGLSDFTPMGAVYGLDEMQRSLRAGDQQGAQLAALGVVPGYRQASKVASKVASEIPQGIRAYHGSPHDFDKFDISKIGTGEGAQSYGHGLYFAESPNVARTYQAKVSSMNNAGEATINGRKINWNDPYETAAFELTRHNGDRAAAADFYAKTFRDGDVTKLLRSEAELPQVTFPGKMYEVNINARPEQFLDWDKPLSQQTNKNVADVFGFSPLDTSAQKARLAELEATRPFNNSPAHTAAAEEYQQLLKTISDFDPTGSSVYRGLSNRAARDFSIRNGSAGGSSFDDIASQKLREAGIPGIRYLDQGSRNTGQGTSNYVLFNDNLIDILRKYGLGGAAFGMGAAATSQAPTGDVY